MKLRLLTYALLACNMTTVFAGGYWSSEQKPKIKIAKVEVLRARAKKTDVSIDLLNKLKILETLADKDLTSTEISKEIDTIFQNDWNNSEAQLKQHMNNNEHFPAERDAGKKNFDDQMAKLKPLIIALLTKNDTDATEQLPTAVEVNEETEGQQQEQQ